MIKEANLKRRQIKRHHLSTRGAPPLPASQCPPQRKVLRRESARSRRASGQLPLRPRREVDHRPPRRDVLPLGHILDQRKGGQRRGQNRREAAGEIVEIAEIGQTARQRLSRLRFTSADSRETCSRIICTIFLRILAKSKILNTAATNEHFSAKALLTLSTTLRKMPRMR